MVDISIECTKEVVTVLYGEADNRGVYTIVGNLYMGGNEYHVYNLHFYNDDGIILSIDLDSSAFLGYKLKSMVFNGETKRKMKLKFDKTNFIIKNDKISYSYSKYDMYVYVNDKNTVKYEGKYIDRRGYDLYKRYTLCGKYVYDDRIKSFNTLLERNSKKIKREYNLIDYPYIYTHDKGMEQDYLKKHMDNILKYNQRIQNTIQRMFNSKTFNTIEVYD